MLFTRNNWHSANGKSEHELESHTRPCRNAAGMPEESAGEQLAMIEKKVYWPIYSKKTIYTAFYTHRPARHHHIHVSRIP